MAHRWASLAATGCHNSMHLIIVQLAVGCVWPSNFSAVLGLHEESH